MTSDEMWWAFAAHIQSCPGCADDRAPMCPEGKRLHEAWCKQCDREDAADEAAEELADQGWRGNEPADWSPER